MANTDLNVKKFKPMPLKLGTSHGCPFSPQLFKIEPEFLDRAIKLKEFKEKQIRKEVKVSLSAGMIVSKSDPKTPIKEFLELTLSACKIAKYNFNS